jgi:hypothetical protein
MSITLKLYALEIAAIRSWYEYVRNNTVLYGGFDPALPLEQELLRKLDHHEDEMISFTETEIEIICGWMNRAVNGKYGSEEYLFGYELRAYTKLKTREGILQP